MKKPITPAWVLLSLAFLAGMPAGARGPAEGGRTALADTEKFLRGARVMSVSKEVSAGRSRPWIVTLTDGSVRRRAIFKYFDYRRPQAEPHSYKYELAAYQLDKLLGAEIVPPAVERKVEGRKGSLQIFLDNCVSEQDRQRKRLTPPDPVGFARALEGVRAFEGLVNDECRDTSDLYVGTDDWHVWRVDFSEAFAPSRDLRDGCQITVCSRRFYEGLVRSSEPAIRLSVRPYLSEQETEALLSRRIRLVAVLRALIADKGAEAVLY